MWLRALWISYGDSVLVALILAVGLQWASNVKRKIEELSILPSSMSDAILLCNVSWVSIFFLVDDSAAGTSHEKSPPSACPSLFLITWPKKEGTWNVNVACELKHKVKSDES
jgi:hypothetical protein